MRKLLVVASTLFMAACGQAPETPELETSRSEIVNGYLDDGHYPVVSIASSSNFVCTGTMIGRRTVLTAAHCFQQGGRVTVSGRTHVFDPEYHIWEDAPFSEQGTVSNHPSYPSGPDVAVIVLDWEVGGAVLAGLSNSTPVASQVTLVGFGYTSAGAADYGVLRYGFNAIDSVDTTYFYHSGASGSDATICFGDSGGPAFIGGYTSRCIAGVASATFLPACTGAGGVHTRVDNAAAWIRSVAPEGIPGC